MVKFRLYDPDVERPKIIERTEQPKKQEQKQEAPVVQEQPRRGIVLDWYSQLGWNQNPFTMTLPAHTMLTGYNEEKRNINLFFVKKANFGLIRGSSSSGVSTMLAWVAEELKHYADRYEVVRLHGSMNQQQFAKALAAPYETMLKKLRATTPEAVAAFLKARMKKQLVALIDDADQNAALSLYYRALLSSGAIVILAGRDPPVIQQDQLAIRLKELSAADARQIIEIRIQAAGGKGIEPFTAALINQLWSAAEHNIAKFLQFCAETAMRISLKDYEVPQEKEEPKQKTKKQKTPAAPKEDSRANSTYDDLIEKIAK